MLGALGGVAALAVLPVALVARPATAAPCYGDCQPGVVRGGGVLRYDASVGFDDQITVSLDNGFLVLTDPTGLIASGTSDCTVTPHQARCPAGPAPSVRIRGLDGDDVITNTTGFPSTLFGNAGNDQVTGGSGADRLVGGRGSDVLRGGDGSDTAAYAEFASTLGLHADLDGATGDDGNADDGPEGARDTIAADVENLEGNGGDDVLIGNAGPNVIDGGNGNDRIQGLGGDDQLLGRTGTGTLDGGAGTDRCTSDNRSTNAPPYTFVGCEITQIIGAGG
ncbi:hypothetical protein MF672_031785 [Actinomadura sp. ATCC 31491]|uniref:Calcium-binding protein n=1 Tax=Actinomadura luzonensis TaxID=2805427 RepID=A0ABT0G2D0_9ACTN|nr:calcium-binding protein [Actinomadura luzonensis]MCK2218340.1 hypothetical protein [Actinomadura luzonensis]